MKRRSVIRVVSGIVNALHVTPPSMLFSTGPEVLFQIGADAYPVLASTKNRLRPNATRQKTDWRPNATLDPVSERTSTSFHRRSSSQSASSKRGRCLKSTHCAHQLHPSGVHQSIRSEIARFTAVDRVHQNPSGTHNPSVLTNKLNCSDASPFEGYTQTDVFPRNAAIGGVHNASIGKIKSRSAFDWKQFLLRTIDDPYVLVVSDCDVAKACTALAVIILRQHEC